MPNDYKLNQEVMTPFGKASFIGYMGEGHEVQVSRHVPATELSKDECIAHYPGLKEYTQIEFINWQRTAKFCINEIYALGEISDPKARKQAPVPSAPALETV